MEGNGLLTNLRNSRCCSKELLTKGFLQLYPKTVQLKMEYRSFCGRPQNDGLLNIVGDVGLRGDQIDDEEDADKKHEERQEGNQKV